MNQPELGRKICEHRKRMGITQKELSESCNIDIRTIQRIESGEVIPRTSTTKLIAEALGIEHLELAGNNDYAGERGENSSKLLPVSFIIGWIYFISWFFSAPLFPGRIISGSSYWIFSIINVITSVFFYYGFYIIAGYYRNRMLKFASVFFMVGGPGYFLVSTLNNIMGINPEGYINQLVLSLLGINCLIFGLGLLKTKTYLTDLYKSTGILQLIIAPFFILPLGTLNIIGCWINIPLYVLMLLIIYMEYKNFLKQG